MTSPNLRPADGAALDASDTIERDLLALTTAHLDDGTPCASDVDEFAPGFLGDWLQENRPRASDFGDD